MNGDVASREKEAPAGEAGAVQGEEEDSDDDGVTLEM